MTEFCEKSFQNQRLVWTKLIARKGTSIHEHCLGRSDSKNRNILDQAIDIAELSSFQKYNFSSVKVNFIFVRDVTRSIKQVLEERLNIQCLGPIDPETFQDLPVSVVEDPYETDYQLILEEFFEIFEEEDMGGSSPTAVPNFHLFDSTKVNLDVTTMLTYCTNLTHGTASLPWENLKYQFIAYQAKDERSSHVRPVIDQYLHNKQVLITETAKSEFLTIIEKVAGPRELKRAEKLLNLATLIPDNPSDKSLLLPVSSKMSDRSVNIFGTGDSLNIPTITGNIGFVRAAGQNGVNFCVLTHEPRVLTEQKEMENFPDHGLTVLE